MKWYDAIPWILVIVGWLVALHQSKTHDKRIDLRSMIDRIVNLLSELEVAALRYHTTAAVDGIDSLAIKSKIERVSFYVKFLGILEYKDFYRVVELRKAITLKNFETASHRALDSDSNILSGIGSAVNDLAWTVEERYREKYLNN